MRLDCRTLAIGLAGDPFAAWGSTLDGLGSADLGKSPARIPQEIINQARLTSGTYTDEQYLAFMDSVALAAGTGDIPVFPPEMPADRTLAHVAVCHHCRIIFRSCEPAATLCFECQLIDLRPADQQATTAHHRWETPGREWTLELKLATNWNRTADYLWYSCVSEAPDRHQGLRVERSTTGAIRKLTLTTVAPKTKRSYRLAYDLVSDVEYTNLVETGSADDFTALSLGVHGYEALAWELIHAKFPPFMAMAYCGQP